MFQTIKNWILYSSANPQEFSLSLKAGIPFLVFLGLGGFFSASDANTLIDALTGSLVALGTFMTSIMTAYGILRKIFLTIKK